MPSIAEHIQAWREQKISGTLLMRLIVSHDEWSMPVSETAVMETLATNAAPSFQYNRDANGVNRLLLWSSSETFSNWAKRAQIPGEQHVITTKGSWVFGLPLDGIDEIWIDPLNANDIFYRKEQFERLHDFAGAVAVEKDIADIRAETPTEGAYVRVREYPKYLVAMGQLGDVKRLVNAPDDQGRTLVAIFTTDDTFEAFTPVARRAAPVGEELTCVQTNGKGLFSAIAGMNVVGLVFNCSGPIKPVAFIAAFARTVLEA